MQANSNTKRTLLNRISWRGIGVLLLVGLLGSVAALLPLTRSEAATNSTLNFQARLQNASGGIVADGYYNIEFKLYNVSSAGTALWTEDYIDTNGASAGNDFRVRVKNGYISVNLGSLTSFPNTINWDQDLWLTMNVGGVAQTASPTWDGEMNPRLKVTSVPYAFRAGQLAVNSGSNTSTLSLAAPTGGNQNFVIPDQGAAGTYNLLTQSAANGSYIQNTTSQQTANFNISGNGVAGGYIDATGGFRVNGTSGATTTCSGGQFLQNATTVGGIVTGGSCAAVVGDGGVTTVGAIDSQTKSANGVVISGTNIYMQTADGTNPGLVSAGAQTFGGAKTFNGAITASGGISGNGSGLTSLNASNLSSGTVANGRISGSYTGISGTGALGAGSITSGFGTISTGNNISTTATVQGANVNATGNIQTGGTTRIDSSGVFTGAALNVTGLVSATAIDVTGYVTSNTSNTNAGQWTKLASCTLAAQYGDCRIQAAVVMTGDGSSETTRAQVDWRVKQQAAFGSDPVIRTELSDVRNLTTANFSSVIISNAGPTVVELWGMIPGMYQNWKVSPLLNGGNIRANFVSTQGFSASLPAGTAVSAVYADTVLNSLNSVTGYSFNGTAGASTTCTGGQFLQNATIQGGIVTGGACATASNGVTTVGTFSATSIANGASISGNTITFGAADATNPGMVSIVGQTFAGAKTFNGAITASGGISGNGSGLTSLNATNLSSGTVASGRISGSYTGITGTGALAAGSIASGFGTISTANNITTTTTVQGATINATTGFQVNGVAGASTTCTGGQFLQNATVTGGIVTAASCGTATSGVTTVGTFSGTSIANGASISGNTITFGAADATNPGMVSTGAQTFAGAKTFSGAANSGIVNVTDGTATGSIFINNASGNAGVQFGSTSNHNLGFFTANGSPSLILTTGGNLNVVGGGLQTNGTTRIDNSGNFNGGSVTSSSTVQGATINATSGFQVNGVAGAAVSCNASQFLQNATIAGGIVTGGTCAAASNGVTTVGTFSGTTSYANGASISGNTITFGAADTSNPGLVSIGTQTFGGNKTISSLPNSFPLRLTDGTVTIGAYINNASAAAGGKAQFGTVSNTDLAFITNNSSAQLILTTTGNLNLVSGAYQTNGTTRIDTSGNFTGNGANITALNAGNISTGTLGIARGGTGSTSYTTNGVVYSNGSALVSTAAGATGQCLKGDTSAAPTWGACGTASTMQDTYDNSTSPQIQLNSTKGAVVYRDASTTIGNLFQLQNSAGTATYFSVSSSAVNLQNTSGNSVFSLNMGTGHLLVYNPANSANYADIYWDGTAGQAVFAASAGNTTRVGNGSGNISLQLTNAADLLVGTKTATLSSGYSSNDFSFTRNISAGANSLTGSVVKVESTSTGTGTVGSNLLWINENNNSATGNLILATKGGAGNNKFVVDTNGNTTAAGTITGAAGFVAAAGQAYTGAGAVTLSSGASSALTLSGATGVTVNTGTGNLQIGSATTDSTANLLVLDSYNQATDPTGVNGAMYYNTSMNAFRCYENGAWKNCIFPQAQVFQVNDQTANSSSTTFQNSSDLAAPLAANSVYSFEAIIPINIGNATADAKYTFTVPSGASIYTNGTAPLTSSTNVICNATASGQTCSVAVSASIQSVISVAGTVYTAGTAGNLQFQFAQNTSTATSNPVLMKGASIKYYKQ